MEEIEVTSRGKHYEFVFTNQKGEKIMYQSGEEFYVDPDPKKVVEAVFEYAKHMQKLAIHAMHE